ncbi:MAG TPA: SRPBCC domain-containing protein [Caulobacteraceae bacterium]|nr:SRPBCC domain-containing protein [Caulobacteraceae bacterium]
MTSRVLVALRVKADPARAFDVFTRETALWWKPNGLFNFTPRSPGVMSFEPGEGGRFVETLPGGKVFEIGRIHVWAPGERLVFGWRCAWFPPEVETTVEVRFEAVGEETRITVEHAGWDAIPRENAARHGFPLDAFQMREAEWWRSQLASLGAAMDNAAPPDSSSL